MTSPSDETREPVTGAGIVGSWANGGRHAIVLLTDEATTDLATLIDAALARVRAEATAAERARFVRAMCPSCARGWHVLDNGRVWSFCGARRLMPALTEQQIAAAILAPPETRTDEGGHAMTSPSDETERLPAILRAICGTSEPTSGVRFEMLSFNETVAYDAIVALFDRVRAEATAAERARCQGIARKVMAGFTALLAGTETKGE